MISFDKRLEILQALVLAVRQINTDELNNELDWVEYPNIPYVRELVAKINIKKYPEAVDFVNNIKDCGYYTRLFLYFDEEFNFNSDVLIEPFYDKSVLDFANFIKKIYENENLDETFVKYKSYLDNFEQEFNRNHNFDFVESLEKMYGGFNDIIFNSKISLLINGGFSSSCENEVSYVRGVRGTEFFEYYIVCLFHEYSHFFVNSIVDKYYDEFNNLDNFYEESLVNGLPQAYQNKKTMLYEYFVRANSLILAESMVTKQEYDENIEWYNEIGFVRMEELIVVIKEGLKNNLKFEEIFRIMCIDYLNNLSFDKSKNI